MMNAECVIGHLIPTDPIISTFPNAALNPVLFSVA